MMRLYLFHLLVAAQEEARFIVNMLWHDGHETAHGAVERLAASCHRQ